MYFFKSVITAVAITAATAAQADLFQFSYSADRVTGTFEGTAVGDLVTGLTDIHVNYSGGSSGPHVNWSATSDSSFVASFSGLSNSFSFIGVANWHPYQFYPENPARLNGHGFYMTTYPSSLAGASLVVGNSAIGLPSLMSIYTDGGPVTAILGADGSYSVHGWTLVNLTMVPEPESYALMLAGLGFIGGAIRRRKQKTTLA